MGDEDLGAVLEILAQEERADLDQVHGEHILAMLGDADKSREPSSHSLFDALARGHHAMDTERGEQGS
jgi:hypothetical protein